MGSWLASDPETLQSGANFGAAGNASPARARALPPLLNHFVSVLSVQSVVKSFRREGGAEGITGCRHLIKVAIGNLSFGSTSSAISQRVGVDGAIVGSSWICHATRRGNSCRIGVRIGRGGTDRAGSFVGNLASYWHGNSIVDIAAAAGAEP